MMIETYCNVVERQSSMTALLVTDTVFSKPFYVYIAKFDGEAAQCTEFLIVVSMSSSPTSIIQARDD